MLSWMLKLDVKVGFAKDVKVGCYCLALRLSLFLRSGLDKIDKNKYKEEKTAPFYRLRNGQERV